MKKTIVFLAVAVLAACGGRGERFDNGVYRNDRFGLTVEVPEGMHALFGEPLDAFASEVGGTGDPLLLVSRREAGADDSLFNYTLSIVAEPIDKGMTDERYAAVAADAIVAALGGEVPDMQHVTVGGREFVHFAVTAGGGIVQDIHTRVERDNALVVTTTYDNSSRAAVGELLRAVKFDER